MMGNPYLIITSIQAPNPVMREFAESCAANGFEFVVIGDSKSPPGFALDGCRFLDLEAQRSTALSFAKACPHRHYARKNIGYLLAMTAGADMIVETDDDNFPMPAFWEPRRKQRVTRCLDEAGWTNVYRYFADRPIWPRGLPLPFIHTPLPEFEALERRKVLCPIQQGLADANPDVDAIYRLTMKLPFNFRGDVEIALGRGTWCPFNSQNTTWWPEAYPLLYLPAYCSFRMTDIWRSFVAQRIAWANDWHILFHPPTVIQERNDHDLMRDFEDEIPGYVSNQKIAELLSDLPIEAGISRIGENLLLCYDALVKQGFIGGDELPLLRCWIEDCAAASHAGRHQ